jgi:hypothetical protein
MNKYTTCITCNDVSKWGRGEGDELGMRKEKIRIEIKGLGFRNTCRSVHVYTPDFVLVHSPRNELFCLRSSKVMDDETLTKRNECHRSAVHTYFFLSQTATGRWYLLLNGVTALLGVLPKCNLLVHVRDHQIMLGLLPLTNIKP